MSSIRYLVALAALAVCLVLPAAASAQLVGPTADFTTDATTGTAPLTVTFTDASQPSLVGGTMTWAWDFGDGETSTEQNPPAHVYDAPGTYVVSLTVSDDGGTSEPATETITVSAPNAPPMASATATPQSGTAPLEVQFGASGSSDSDGTIASYEWDFGVPGDETDTSTAAAPTFTYQQAGTYTATLTVTDDDGATATTSTVVTVNAAPTASFTSADGDLPREFDFTDASTDSDGTVASWSWDFGAADDASDQSNVQNPSYRYASPGPYTVTLTVTDNDGGTHRVTQPVVVGNDAPTAGFTASPASGTAPLQVSFADVSTDVDGAVAKWAWDFGDGSTSDEQNPTHTYTERGSYDVTLTVTDNDLAESTVVTKRIEVNARPSASFTASSLTGEAPFDPTFTATATDSDGTIESYEWSFGDGTTGSGASVSHRYAAPGTYDVRLTVTDDDGATSSATQTVAVTLPPESIPAGPAAPTLQKVLTDLLIETPGPCSVRMLTASALVVCGGNSRRSLSLRTWAVNAEGAPVAATITGTERIPRSAGKRGSARKSAKAKRVRYRARRGMVPAHGTKSFKLKAPKKLRRALARRLKQRGRIKRKPVVVLRAGGLSATMTHNVIARQKKKKRR